MSAMHEARTYVFRPAVEVRLHPDGTVRSVDFDWSTAYEGYYRGPLWREGIDVEVARAIAYVEDELSGQLAVLTTALVAR